ncbi:MAG: homocysteine S-methyltransferase family protein [Pseudomonadota bacterium]
MADITLLDGSIGQEIMKRSGDKPTPLWSTRVMIDHPKLVGEVHLEYFKSGATVATTNTYAVLRDRLRMVDLEDEMATLTSNAVLSARRARAAHGSGRIAGSIGPLGASYRPDLCPPPNEAAAIYAEHVALLKDDVDVFLLETMSSVEQAEGGLLATTGHGKPVWLAVTVDDDDGGRLRSGEPLQDLTSLVSRFAPDVVLINCSRPEAVTVSLEIVAGFGRPFGAYANGFTRISEGFLQTAPTVDHLTERTDLGPEAYARFAMRWVDQGASVVGGCCEVGPAHIAELARALEDAGHRIV